MRTILVALSLGLACVAAEPADEPAPSSFAWRGTLDTGGQSGLVRAAVGSCSWLARTRCSHSAQTASASVTARSVGLSSGT